MTEDITCPAEGCDYTAETTGSIRSHINAKSGAEHQDKEALRAALEKQGETSTDESGENEGQQGDDEQGETTAQGGVEGGAPDGSSENDPEQGEKQGEAAEKQENDHPETDPMPTDDELERQRDQATTTPSQGDDGGKSTPSKPTKQAQPAPSSGGVPIPVSTTTLFAGVALVVILVVLWSYLGTDDSDQPAEITDGTDEEEDGFDAFAPDDMEAAQ